MSNPVYLVVVLSDVEAVRKRLRKVVPEETMIFEVDEDKWFVSFDGISRDLANKLGIRGEPNTRIHLQLQMPLLFLVTTSNSSHSQTPLMMDSLQGFRHQAPFRCF